MQFVDIYVEGISSYLSDVALETVRQNAFAGHDIETVRLDIRLGKEILNYGKTSIYSLNRDIIYELERVLEGASHFFQLDGYDFLPMRRAGDVYEVELKRGDEATFTSVLSRKEFIRSLVNCLRLAENAIDALRQC